MFWSYFFFFKFSDKIWQESSHSAKIIKTNCAGFLYVKSINAKFCLSKPKGARHGLWMFWYQNALWIVVLYHIASNCCRVVQLHWIVLHCIVFVAFFCIFKGLSAIALELTAAQVSGHLKWREGKHLKLGKFNLNLLLTARRRAVGESLCKRGTKCEGKLYSVAGSVLTTDMDHGPWAMDHGHKGWG